MNGEEKERTDRVKERPSSREALGLWMQERLRLKIPGAAVCAGHAAPLDYLWYSFSGDWAELREAGRTNGDCVVWANRGGGKTLLAASATLLEGLFKPQCKTRILGGSLEQSRRMYEYLTEFAAERFGDELEGKVLARSCGFVNGARVSILPQSDRAVRGLHVHKLRCDEADLFDEKVYRAAGFITKSGAGLLASMEVLSTMHRPYGLMQRIATQAAEAGTPVFRWCMWETIEKCTDRSCSCCPLNSDCGQKARRADGYMSIDDCITQMRRSSRAAFEAEMLCLRPNMEGAVFTDFDAKVHVRPVEYNPNLPLHWGMDFGFHNPLVCLWIQKDQEGNVYVLDEHVRSYLVIAEHFKVLEERTPIAVERLASACCDPAGRGRNGVTGTSEIDFLSGKRVPVKCRPSTILEGVELIRRALRNGAGRSSLVISPRCKHLIAALECYHYPEQARPNSEQPLKDGVYDHPVDALRYFFVNEMKGSKTVCRRY